MHGRRRQKLIGYGQQLREKQKVKRIYGVLEKQFRLYFQHAEKKKGITGETLLVTLEKRLDNVVYRIGFASSRTQARQFVSHGHVYVNGKRVDISSYQVRPGEEISLGPRLKKNLFIQNSMEAAKARGVPEWLSLDAEECKGFIQKLPIREDIQYTIQEQLIVELYSK
jgi:small subunit ribosomal protein S4